MRPYSVDLRQRVVEALLNGQTQPDVARRFSLSLSSVQRYARQWREHRDLAPKPIPGRARRLTLEQQGELVALVRSRPDWTLSRLKDAWMSRSGQSVSVATMHRYVQRGDNSHKKSVG